MHERSDFAAQGQRFARIIDNPGGTNSAVIKRVQQFETGAICTDPMSNDYLEVYGTVGWKYTYLQSPTMRTFLTVQWPWQDELRIDAAPVVGQTYRPMRKEPTTGGKPTQRFLSIITSAGGHIYW